MSLKEMHWRGYLRKNGSKGIRNKVLVIYTVECSSFVSKEIVRRTGNNDVEVIGFQGCTDNQYAVRLLIAMIRHPNVGAVLVIGLGCEYIQPEWLAEIAGKEGKISNWMFIQKEGGTTKTINKGIKLVIGMLKQLQQMPQTDMTAEDLIIGAECGGSDYTSGLAGNTVVGCFYDSLIDAGGTAIFEEIVEAVGLDKFLETRGVDKQVKEEIRITYDKAMEYCRSVRQYSVSPGNFAGGLSSIEEKSMGAVAKSGTRPIQGVLKVSERPNHNGLWLLDTTPDPYWMQFGITNPNDNEGLTDLISCGSQIVFLVTGRGSVVGSAVAPCIKITGNSTTYKNLEDDIDFNAGPVLDGECTSTEIAQCLADLVEDVISGKLTKSEVLGHKEYYIPYKYQNKEVILPCRQ
jgi:altronate dehydratase large subunit